MWTLRKKPVQHKNKIYANFNLEFGLHFFRTHHRANWNETKYVRKIALQKAENLELYQNLNFQWFRMKL